MKTITKILDWLSTFFSRVKGIGFLVALVAFIIFFVNNGCQKKHAEQLIEKITGLNIQNDLLMKDNKEKDSLLLSEQIQRQKLESEYQFKVKERDRLFNENQRLKTQLKGISNYLLNIPADSSYAFLDKIAYPYEGEKKYPFNEPQVKNIHKDFLENTILTTLVDTLTAQVSTCEGMLTLKDSMGKSYENTIALEKEKGQNYEKAMSNNTQKESIYKKEIKKISRQKTFYKFTTGIAVIVALIIAL